MSTETEPVLIRERLETGIERLWLNRPEARNALSRALVAELEVALANLADDASLRVVIVAARGERAFCAGADLIERTTMSTAARTAHTTAIAAMFDSVAALPVPVIAAIHGFALAGGTELSLACDLRVASDSAVFGLPEVKIGIFPGAGGVARLPKLVGTSAANDLLYSGRQIRADEAYRIGLVDEVVSTEALQDAALRRATEIASNAPLAIRALKRALRESDGLSVAAANEIIATHRRPLDDTEDYAEGLRAFAEKRKPVFRGR